MPVQKAVHAYKQEKLNCAQSVLRGFQEKKRVAEEVIQEARAFGGGRAPEGRCGALHAALILTKSPVGKEHLTHAFVEKAGSDKCREIRKLGKLTCEGCVTLAAEELAKVSEMVD